MHHGTSITRGTTQIQDKPALSKRHGVDALHSCLVRLRFSQEYSYAEIHHTSLLSVLSASDTDSLMQLQCRLLTHIHSMVLL